MERVAFLIEETGERIRCLLNPETIVVRRQAGVRHRPGSAGPLAAGERSHDPLLLTGGGRTEMELHLLFDLAAEGADRSLGDVRRLTLPLWRLVGGSSPMVRLIWGKTWNIPAIVAAAAEKVEQLDAGGAPRRSWLTLCLIQVEEPADSLGSRRRPPRPGKLKVSKKRGNTGRSVTVKELTGDGSGHAGERLDQIAEAEYGDPAYWRLLASANGLADPLGVPVGARLRVPEAGGA